jgi:hypothetical protein
MFNARQDRVCNTSPRDGQTRAPQHIMRRWSLAGSILPSARVCEIDCFPTTNEIEPPSEAGSSCVRVR